MRISIRAVARYETRLTRLKKLAILAGWVFGCSQSAAVGPGHTKAQTQVMPARTISRRVQGISPEQISGKAFPDHVIALTWDDGPDAHTLELARYLKSEHVSATFFVVKDWRAGLSSDPGGGRGVFSTGYAAIAVLSDLVALGHRLGNHTQSHVLLTEATPQMAVEQISNGQRGSDRYASNELRLFRAPGGAWSNPVATATDFDPYLRGVLAPIRWDVDRKDWENSLGCNSKNPQKECERRPNESGWRTKPAVIARRYLDSIFSQRHGIVLLHDRVGDVGSHYALELARVLVPALKSRGYTFSAPILQFSPIADRVKPTDTSELPSLDPSTLQFAAAADQHAQLCGESELGLLCVPASLSAPSVATPTPFSSFGGVRIAYASESRKSAAAGATEDTTRFGDVDGDGVVDYCTSFAQEIECGLGARAGRFNSPTRWWQTSFDAQNVFDSKTSTITRASFGFWLADIDGDGLADVCRWAESDLQCAISQGHEFGRMNVWLSESERRAADTELCSDCAQVLQFGDVNGDGRADVCGVSPQGVTCALSNGNHFGALKRWSIGTDVRDFERTPWFVLPHYRETMRLGDLNGDGQADLCYRAPAGMTCALSTGSEFLEATLWLHDGMSDADGWLAPRAGRSLELVDLNGDGRADLCGILDDRVLCAIAP